MLTKTDQMRTGISTIGDQLSICINQPGLPADEESRGRLLHDVEMAVEAVLAEYDHTRPAEAHRRPRLPSITADFPCCGERLQLIELRLDYSNGASATASCECGWYGEAVYRLIDHHEIRSGNQNTNESDANSDSTSIVEDSSSVRRYSIRPQYTLLSLQTQ